MLAVAITPLELHTYCTKRSDLGDSVWGEWPSWSYPGCQFDQSHVLGI